jgi:hypothetical protein
VCLAILLATLAVSANADSTPAQIDANAALKYRFLQNPMGAATLSSWTHHTDGSFSPVVDSVSAHLAEADRALEGQDRVRAQAMLTAASLELRAESRLALARSRGGKGLDLSVYQDGAQRLDAAAARLDRAARRVASGALTTLGQLDRLIDPATRADIDRRWLVVGAADWYRLAGATQTHFEAAAEAHEDQNFQIAAIELGRARAFLCLEAGRSSAVARTELLRSIAQIDALLAAPGRLHEVKTNDLAKVFARASSALARADRAKSAEFWAANEASAAGYALRAAADSLESGLDWIGGPVKRSAPAGIAATRALGESLVADDSASNNIPVEQGLRSLDRDVSFLDEKISKTGKGTARRLVVSRDPPRSLPSTPTMKEKNDG